MAFDKHFTSKFDYNDLDRLLRDQPSEIVDRLWLGNFSHAINGLSLNTYKFDFIFNIGVPFKYRKVEYNYTTPSHSIKIWDGFYEPIDSHFESLTEMIHSRLENGEIVYVHCHEGVSRSSTIIIAYLIRYYGMDADEAFEFVKDKRSRCFPNFGFRKQLRSYHKTLNPMSNKPKTFSLQNL